MQTSGEETSKLTFQGMTAQVALYLQRAAKFPYDWGLADSGPITANWRPRLFHYDAKRLNQLIVIVEHMIRCLIIWLAFRKMRDETITPCRFFIPTPPPAGTRFPQAPIDYRLAARGVPLFEPKPPPFLISMPEDRSSLRERQTSNLAHTLYGAQPHLSKTGRRRNDDILSDDALYLRLDRLDALYASIDSRAARLAARWAGQLKAEQASPLPPAGQNTPSCTYAEEPRPFDMNTRHGQPVFRPLKTHDPPADLLAHAQPDEAEDLHILHDVAIRAAEGFTALCG